MLDEVLDFASSLTFLSKGPAVSICCLVSAGGILCFHNAEVGKWGFACSGYWGDFHVLGYDCWLSNIPVLFCLEAFAQCVDLLSASVCLNSTSYSTQFISGRIYGTKYRSQEMFIKRKSYHKWGGRSENKQLEGPRATLYFIKAVEIQQMLGLLSLAKCSKQTKCLQKAVTLLYS